MKSEGYHTNGTESFWNQIKGLITSMNGVIRGRLPNYLDDFHYMYKKCQSSRAMCFNKILDEISKLYKVLGVEEYGSMAMCTKFDVSHKMYAKVTEFYRQNKQLQVDNCFIFF